MPGKYLGQIGGRAYPLSYNNIPAAYMCVAREMIEVCWPESKAMCYELLITCRSFQAAKLGLTESLERYAMGDAVIAKDLALLF